MTPEQLDMYKRLQPLYKRVMGEWQQGDKGYSEVLKRSGFYFNTLSFPCLRIPLTIDTEHHERGLWGMLDWNKLRQEQYGPDGEIAIYKLPYIEYCEELGIPVKDHPFVVGDPTTAILKALCEQEGV